MGTIEGSCGPFEGSTGLNLRNSLKSQEYPDYPSYLEVGSPVELYKMIMVGSSTGYPFVMTALNLQVDLVPCQVTLTGTKKESNGKARIWGEGTLLRLQKQLPQGFRI